MELKEKLLNIQIELKAPKNQKNTFGNYNFRSAEDILEAVKPLCFKYKALLVLSDEIIVVGQNDPIIVEEQVYSSKLKKEVTQKTVYGAQRFYTKATATLLDVESDAIISATASAREEETKTGMDLSQLTGSTSSYARKYALNGLFDVDDTKDSDATNKHNKVDDEEDTEQKATKSQLDILEKAYTDEVQKQICEHYKIAKLAELTLEQASELVQRLAQKAGQKK